MKYPKLIGLDGLIHIQKPADELPKSIHREIKNEKELIEYCINCKKQHCSGICEDFKRYKRKIRSENKNDT